MATLLPLNYNWQGTSQLGRFSFQCGYCGDKVGANAGFFVEESAGDPQRRGRQDGKQAILICPTCNRPSLFTGNGWKEQSPSPILGRSISYLDPDIERLYTEARTCTQVAAYTACILVCRKLLMHLAVEKGAATNLRFIQFVDYLVDHHWIPPNGKAWVDRIRERGNEATHEIVHMTRDDAAEILAFVEMLLVFMYEFPARLGQAAVDPPT